MPALATRLATGQAERRHVTVMFCDLAGSSRLSSTLDPEDFGELLAAYRSRAAAIVERYGGAVLRYVGDGILACWGYPRALEHDAARSIAAALDLVEILPPLGRDLPFLSAEITVRVALDAGICVVGSVAGAEDDILGDAPNTAALLQGHAAPNTILVSRAVQDLGRDAFRFEPAATVALKTGEPCDTFRVVAREKAWWRRGQAPDSSLVGRDAECARLDAAWDRMREPGGAIVIAGEPGIGKSMLMGHLRRRATADGATWHEAWCAPEGEQSALQPFRDVVADDVGLAAHATAEDRAAR